MPARLGLKSEQRGAVSSWRPPPPKPGARGNAAEHLAGQRRLMAGWLRLDDVMLHPLGDDAEPPRAALQTP